MSYYGGIVWTNHSLSRLNERGISMEMALSAFTSFDRKFNGKEKDTTVFQKKIDKLKITLVATQNEKNEWVVISAWIDPPLYGTTDFRKKKEFMSFQKTSGLKRFILIAKQQLGL